MHRRRSIDESVEDAVGIPYLQGSWLDTIGVAVLRAKCPKEGVPPDLVATEGTVSRAILIPFIDNLCSDPCFCQR